MKTLLFTAVTSAGMAYDIEFPLHAQTRSPEAVSHLLTSLLDTLSNALARSGDIADGDVFQALAMALAVRARMVDAQPDSVERLVKALLNQAYRATQEARSYMAARA